MKFRLIVSAYAELDIADIKEWYLLCSEEIQAEFLNELRYVINQITIDPHQFSKIKGQLRKAVLQKFPYTIIYQIINDSVIIIAIIHQRRSPKIWKSRI